ncbi:MAG: DNA-processing protein DprA [Gammaproteobacteria bacterium]
MSLEDTRDERAHWIALHRAPGIGPRAFFDLLARYGSAKAVFAARSMELERHGLGSETLAFIKAPDWQAVTAAVRWLREDKHHLILWSEETYPPLLRTLSDPPPLFYVIGDPGILARPQIAVVGSRHPTAAGEQTALEFSRQLVLAGWVITSGLALGIDAAAHRGALAARGATIAVSGTGIDLIYPASNRALAFDIQASGGAIVSELPLGTPAIARNFPRRNRLISGLCLGTVVAEAALRSGSLITARCAIEQGREVFALPGSIHNPLAQGCHGLIQQGAKLVTSVADILEELNCVLPPPAPVSSLPQLPHEASEALDPDYQSLLHCMGEDPVSVDSLVERSGLTASAVSSMLLILELRGYVGAEACGVYVRQK